MATHSAFAEFLLNGKRFIKNSVRKNKRNDSREVKSKKKNYVNRSNSLRASTLSIDVIKKKTLKILSQFETEMNMKTNFTFDIIFSI